MLIIFIFFLASLASLSSGVAFHDHDLESSHEHMRQRSATTKRELTVHAAWVQYHETKLLFGYETYCEDPNPSLMSVTSGYQFVIQDCAKLRSLFEGQDRYGGFWLPVDYNCITSRNGHWWMTVAGWKSCHFAVSAWPDCKPYPIAQVIHSLDIPCLVKKAKRKKIQVRILHADVRGQNYKIRHRECY